MGQVIVKLQPLFDYASYPTEASVIARCLLELRVQRHPQARRQRVGADIFLVLDGSSSMNKPDRYPLLRRAVGEFLARMEPEDRVGIVIFSGDADVVLRPSRGVPVKKAIPRILQAMDSSPRLFRRGTRPAPGLRKALEAFEALGSKRNEVRRVYLLTDGILGDTLECEEVLREYRPRKIEVHVYGFGTRFDAEALKALVADQFGGSVKPICNEKDIVPVFSHVAEVNRRLAAADASLTIGFPANTRCGHAWVFRPQPERHLGQIQNHRLVHELGALETGRTYSVLFEVRLPPATGERTVIGRARLTCHDGEGTIHHTIDLEVPREEMFGLLPAEMDKRVERAHAILEGLVHPLDEAVQVKALKALLEQETEEGRDPERLEALKKQLKLLEGDEEDEVALGELDERDEVNLAAHPRSGIRIVKSKAKEPEVDSEDFELPSVASDEDLELYPKPKKGAEPDPLSEDEFDFRLELDE